MKTIFFLLLLITSICIAQENNFLPLEVDNSWQFDVTHTYDDTISTFTSSMTVLKDTIINNQTYYKVKFPTYYFGPFNYLRYDSTLNSIQEYPLYFDGVASELTFLDFNITVGENFLWGGTPVRCIEDDTSQVFGETKHIKGFIYGDIPSFRMHLAEAFGPIHMFFDESYVVTSFYDYNLRYAYVNGVEYGDKLTSIKQDVSPSIISLYQNYPNPFNLETKIIYHLNVANHVELKIYDITGRELKTLVNQRQNFGDYSFVFRAEGLASGIYIYKIKIGSFEQNRKMILLQ